MAALLSLNEVCSRGEMLTTLPTQWRGKRVETAGTGDAKSLKAGY